MRYRFMLIILLILVSLAEQQARTARAQRITYTDPFAYCAAVGTIDAPDARYVGAKVPDAIARGLRAATLAAPDAPLDGFIDGGSWRCMDGQVYACTVGANLPCWDKANTSQTPTTAMTQYCQANANVDTLPGFVTGRSTVYAWSCQKGVATPGRQVVQVDARGYLADIWYAISPEGTGAQALPRSGAAGIAGTRMGILVALGVLIALLGLLVRRRLAAD